MKRDLRLGSSARSMAILWRQPGLGQLDTKSDIAKNVAANVTQQNG
jgi:hypothetical protein